MATTGSEEVVVASTAPGLQTLSSVGEELLLDLQVLGDRLDGQVDVGEGVVASRPG